MEAREANQQRVVIWALHAQGVGPSEIARQVGCARTTVRRALREPVPDRRSRRSTGFDVLAVGRGLAAIDAVRTRGGDPYRGVGARQYELALRAAPGLAPEAAYARTLLRQILEELEAPGLADMHRHRLRADAARLLGVIARLQQAPGGVARVDGVQWLIELGREKTRARTRGRAAGTAAGPAFDLDERSVDGEAADG